MESVICKSMSMLVFKVGHALTHPSDMIQQKDSLDSKAKYKIMSFIYFLSLLIESYNLFSSGCAGLIIGVAAGVCHALLVPASLIIIVAIR